MQDPITASATCGGRAIYDKCDIVDINSLNSLHMEMGSLVKKFTGEDPLPLDCNNPDSYNQLCRAILAATAFPDAPDGDGKFIFSPCEDGVTAGWREISITSGGGSGSTACETGASLFTSISQSNTSNSPANPGVQEGNLYSGTATINAQVVITLPPGTWELAILEDNSTGGQGERDFETTFVKVSCDDGATEPDSLGGGEATLECGPCVGDTVPLGGGSAGGGNNNGGGTNNPPVPSPDCFEVTIAGGSQTFNLLANDTGATSVTSFANMPIAAGGSVTQNLGAAGSITVNSSGVVTYTPGTTLAGLPLSYPYIATNADGSAGSTFEIKEDTGTGGGNNQPPVTVDDCFEVTALTGNSQSFNLLDNDSDPDNDTLSVVDFNSSVVPAGGSTTVFLGIDQGQLQIFSDGTVTYTPASTAGANTSSLPQTFNYTISDGTDTTVGSVEIKSNDVNPNNAPTCTDIIFGMTPNTQTHVMDFTSSVSDPDGDPLDVNQINNTPISIGQTITLPSGATIEKTGPLTFTYDAGPLGNVDVVDTFTYSVSDGNGGNAGCDTGVRVRNGGSPPTAVNDSFTVTGTAPQTFNILDNDFDVDGDTFRVFMANGVTIPLGSCADIGGNPNSTVIVCGNGDITVTGNGTAHQRLFTYSIVDQNGNTDVASVAIDFFP